MTDLSGIELRKELCEALGWKNVVHDDWPKGTWIQDWRYRDEWIPPNGAARESFRKEDLPKYESDATLSEALLDKVCSERGWLWEVGSVNFSDGTGPRPYYCKIEPKVLAPYVAVAHGKNPSECRARCLLSALRSVK